MPSPSPMFLPVLLIRCLQKEDKDKLCVLEQWQHCTEVPDPPSKALIIVGRGTGLLGDFLHPNSFKGCSIHVLARQQP